MSKNSNPEETGPFNYKFDTVNEIKYLSRIFSFGNKWETEINKRIALVDKILVFITYFQRKLLNQR